MDYAEKLIRGILNPQWIDSDRRLSGEIFQFNESDHVKGFSETSINWYDDKGALEHILSQRKKDEDTPKYKGGAAIIPRCDINSLIDSPFKGLVRYNRNALPDNKYHGNILLKSGLPKSIKNAISQSIALCAETIK